MEVYLYNDFDDPSPIAEFHRELWRMFCSDDTQVAVAAPRGHAKTSAGVITYGLASLLFGANDFTLLVGSTETLAAGHLANISRIFTENEQIIKSFKIEVIKNSETQFEAKVRGRHVCIMVKGAEQKLRGVLWNNKRPDLILIDDLEEDEAVMNPDRREKLRNWFGNALLPCGSRKCKIRMVGTILHLDSLLERLLKEDSGWVTKRFRAHRDFDDFSELLWPEHVTEEKLRKMRQWYISQGNASGYSQEYLSYPIAHLDAYFNPEDFLEMVDEDYRQPFNVYGSVDLAISTKTKADRTAFALVGVDPQNFLCVLHTEAARLDSPDALERLFQLDSEYHPHVWIIEDENMAKSLAPFLDLEMVKRNHYLNILRVKPTKDKRARSRALQARMRAHGVKFNALDEDFADMKWELCAFPRAPHDDRVDALSWLGLKMDELQPALTEEEQAEEDLDAEREMSSAGQGRNPVTGY